MLTDTRKRVLPPHVTLTPHERLSVWERARGMWKNKKPDPLKELAKMRREWDRKLPRI